MKEIKSAKQHTLFVHHEGQRRGICCLRWLTENNEPVLYLYEIQLEASACRFGLGLVYIWVKLLTNFIGQRS